jgi:signal transduction histidine kinase
MTGPSTPTRLLIVDDEQAHLQALCDTLQDRGYVTAGFTNGEAALAALQGSSFDLMLTDLMMPGMDGIALLRAALQIDPTLVTIIMTGEGTIASAVEAMRSGAFDYILKPFKLSAIMPVLTRGLAMRRLQSDNAALARRVQEHAAELEETNRELEAFTRSASHDMRAPLNVVMGFSTLLADGKGPKAAEEQQRWFVHIAQSAKRMSRLMDDLMRLSRLGRQALIVQTVDIDTVVHEVVAELRQQQPERKVTVSVGDLPAVRADAGLLRQVFVNLLSNAFKFTRDAAHATIEVGCAVRDGEQVYFVRDNGLGFDMTRAARLFDAFQRMHQAGDFEGSGVGLSIVQRIVKRHGGRVWAQAAPGQGASFFFTLGSPADFVASGFGSL